MPKASAFRARHGDSIAASRPKRSKAHHSKPAPLPQNALDMQASSSSYAAPALTVEQLAHGLHELSVQEQVPKARRRRVRFVSPTPSLASSASSSSISSINSSPSPEAQSKKLIPIVIERVGDSWRNVPVTRRSRRVASTSPQVSALDSATSVLEQDGDEQEWKLVSARNYADSC